MIQVLLEMGNITFVTFASGSMLFMCDYCKRARIKFNTAFIMASSPT